MFHVLACLGLRPKYGIIECKAARLQGSPQRMSEECEGNEKDVLSPIKQARQVGQLLTHQKHFKK